jgi:chaperonin GroES
MIEPQDDRVLIRRIEEQRAIILTDAPKSLKGIVLAAGPGKRNKSGKRIPLDVKPGDKVLFNSRWNDFSAAEHGRPLRYDQDPMIHLVQEADIFGIVPNFDMKVSIAPNAAHSAYSQNVEIKGPWSDPANHA